MSNPVRIYVLHHPNSAPLGRSSLVRTLTDCIYEWFRLPSLDGIPVYVRSSSASGEDRPLPPYGMKEQQLVLEYLIPLVDAHMVRDPIWHDYLNELASKCDASQNAAPPGYRGVMFPVALDATAFNLPRAVACRNFIRHGLEPSNPSVDPAKQREYEIEETLKHLTEALARDLCQWLFHNPVPSRPRTDTRFKIFISYARAVGTSIAKTLRDYIQSQTQCLAFLDENDIGYPCSARSGRLIPSPSCRAFRFTILPFISR